MPPARSAWVEEKMESTTDEPVRPGTLKTKFPAKQVFVRESQASP